MDIQDLICHIIDNKGKKETNKDEKEILKVLKENEIHFLTSELSIERQLRILSKVKQDSPIFSSIEKYIDKKDKNLLMILLVFPEEKITKININQELNIDSSLEYIINPRKKDFQIAKQEKKFEEKISALRKELQQQKEDLMKTFQGEFNSMKNEFEKQIQNIQIENQKNQKEFEENIQEDNSNLNKKLETLTQNDQQMQIKLNLLDSIKQQTTLIEEIMNDFDRKFINDSNHQSDENFTKLHFASKINDFKMALWLISKGENIKAKDIIY